MSYFVYDEKNIHYSETGTGQPLMLLHGNTASSKMYENIAKEYPLSMEFLSGGTDFNRIK